MQGDCTIDLETRISTNPVWERHAGQQIDPAFMTQHLRPHGIVNDTVAGPSHKGLQHRQALGWEAAFHKDSHEGRSLNDAAEQGAHLGQSSVHRQQYASRDAEEPQICELDHLQVYAPCAMRCALKGGKSVRIERHISSQLDMNSSACF